MPALLSIIGGSLIILIALSDLVWSTLSTSGAGVVSRRVASGLWRMALAVHRRVGSHRFLEASGPLIVVAIVIVWIALLWTGWLLIFLSGPAAVVDATTQAPANFADRVYFVGFTLFTLGVGDFVGGASVWRVLTAVASINGLFTITLAITYLLPVVSAATSKRQLALLIHSLGDTAGEIVANGWSGDDFDGLEPQLREVTSLLLLHSERHLAYPVLHYFHASDPEASLAPKLAALDDAELILSHCVAKEHRPDAAVLRALRHAIDVFLRRVQHRFVVQAEDTPPLPDIQTAEDAGVPVVELDSVRDAFAQRGDRRRWLLGLVRSDGWQHLPA